jgi:amino acid adenylation domain-containing protein
MLHRLVSRAALLRPDAPAVRAPDGQLTYGALDAKANQVARALASMGVVRGDRVAILLPKSLEAVVAMQAVLRLGAAYVPLDPTSPAARARTVISDCGVKALVSHPERAAGLTEPGIVSLLAATGTGWDSVATLSPLPLDESSVGEMDLAYILYTSGSTGRPKGVCISHGNAMAFVEWAVKAFGATESDRFANHAPFHFDLSVLDLYGAFAVGATVCLIPETGPYVAGELVRFLKEERISVWYSVPSALVLMMDHAGLLEGSPEPLRLLLFAGEAFPMKHLRRLRQAWPELPMWNLYGPTETNVCTAYRVTALAESASSVPIGTAVSGDRVWVRGVDGTEARPGEEGELVVEGPTVFLGYWGKEPTRGAPYSTGDIVRMGEDGNLHFMGRRDHMVKIRGHRVELGEVEAALLELPSVHEAATLVSGEGLSARLVAFVGTGEAKAPSLLDVKRHCAERLPRHMIPENLYVLGALPRTVNGKIDRQLLAKSVDVARST